MFCQIIVLHILECPFLLTMPIATVRNHYIMYTHGNRCITAACYDGIHRKYTHIYCRQVDFMCDAELFCIRSYLGWIKIIIWFNNDFSIPGGKLIFVIVERFRRDNDRVKYNFKNISWFKQYYLNFNSERKTTSVSIYENLLNFHYWRIPYFIMLIAIALIRIWPLAVLPIKVIHVNCILSISYWCSIYWINAAKSSHDESNMMYARLLKTMKASVWWCVCVCVKWGGCGAF